VVVMTGDLTRERREEVNSLGADALLEKPIEVRRLVATLRRWQGPASAQDPARGQEKDRQPMTGPRPV